MEGLLFQDLEYEEIIKLPGSIKGESVTISKLTECKVFLLDTSSDVTVSDCTKCKIFIGPVDGLASFHNVKHSQVAVASRNFKASDCSYVDFELLTLNAPSIEGSNDLRFSTWHSTYPKFDDHLASTGLDLNNNSWDKIMDASAGELRESSFVLEEPLVHLEPPDISDLEEAEADIPDPIAPVATVLSFSDPPEYVPGESPLSMPAENGHVGMGTGTFGAVSDIAPAESFRAPPPLDELPTVIAAKEQLKDRLAKQEATETKAREDLLQKATQFIEDFYKKRSTLKAQRAKENRAAAKNSAAKGPEGKTEWERTANLIDFQFGRANGADLSRFKGVLFAAKAKGAK